MEFDLKEIFASYFAWKATEDTWFISFMNGTQYLYLLEGKEKALLIDTGYAVPGLREFVEKLTDKPIEVINTHFHPDHAGGNGEWDRVMVSRSWEKDAPSLKKTAGDPAALPYPDYEKILVGEGDRIELGERTIEVLGTEDCHCYSSLYLFDRSRRLMFMGDEIDSWQVLIYGTSSDPELEAQYDVHTALHSFRSNLKRVRDMKDDFDWLIGNHNGAPLAKSYLDDFIGLTEHVYIGDVTIEEKLNHKFIEMDPISSRLCRVRWKKASIITYTDQVCGLLGQMDLI